MKKLLSLAVLAATIVSCGTNEPKVANYKVNETVSKAEWKGSAPDHFHVGSFKVTGALTATGNGKVTGGDFVIPISSIQDYDLPDPVRQTLLADLKSPNFFNLVTHPDAKFHVTKAEPFSTGDTTAVTGANYMLTGDFSMIGQTHSISFPVKVETDGNGLSADAKFSLNRKQWGMNIYSDPSKPLYILPDVNIHLTVRAADDKLAKL